MHDRPTSITVVGRLFTTSGVFSLLAAYPLASDPGALLPGGYMHPIYELPFGVLLPLILASGAGALVIGIALLSAWSWGRVALVAYCGVWLLVQSALFVRDPLYAFNVVSAAAFTGVMAFLCYRPVAMAYFRGEDGGVPGAGSEVEDG